MADINASMRSMRQAIQKQSTDGDPGFSKTISVLALGQTNGCKPYDFKQWYNTQPHERYPTYVALLDRGVIVTSRNRQYDVFEHEEGDNFVHLVDHKNPSEFPYLCAPGGDATFRRGRAVLWLYLVIANHLSEYQFTQEQRGEIGVEASESVSRSRSVLLCKC